MLPGTWPLIHVVNLYISKPLKIRDTQCCTFYIRKVNFLYVYFKKMCTYTIFNLVCINLYSSICYAHVEGLVLSLQAHNRTQQYSDNWHEQHHCLALHLNLYVFFADTEEPFHFLYRRYLLRIESLLLLCCFICWNVQFLG